MAALRCVSISGVVNFRVCREENFSPPERKQQTVKKRRKPSPVGWSGGKDSAKKEGNC